MNKKSLYISLILIANCSLITAQNGRLKTYHLNDNPESSLFFVNDVLDGECTWWWENGNLKKICNYSDGVLNGTLKRFYEAGPIREEINFNMGVRDGLTKYFYNNGGLKEVRNYYKGRLIGRDFVDYDPTYVAPEILEQFRQKYNISDTDILCNSDICAEPIGGIESIYKKLNYPVDSSENYIEGSVLASLMIDESGKAKNVNIIKSLGSAFDEEVIRALNDTKYLPVKKGGVLIDSYISIKINFVIPDSLLKEVTQEDTVKVDSVKSLLKVMAHSNGSFPKMLISEERFLSSIDLPEYILKKEILDTSIVEIAIDTFGFVRECKVIKPISSSIDAAIKSAFYNTAFEETKMGTPDFIKIKYEIPIDVKYLQKIK